MSRAAEIRDFIRPIVESPDAATLRAFCVAGARWERVRDEVAHDPTPTGQIQLQQLTAALEEFARRLGLPRAFCEGVPFLIADPERLLA